MKTILPTSITTVEEAKTFLTDLFNNNETFHPEDDAHDVAWTTFTPTPEECDQLNKLMEDIYNLPGNDGKHDNSIAFCPCGFLLDLQAARDAATMQSLFEIDGEVHPLRLIIHKNTEEEGQMSVDDISRMFAMAVDDEIIIGIVNVKRIS